MDINPQWITLIFASNAMIASIAGAFVNTRVAKTQFNANVLSVNRQKWIETMRDLVASLNAQLLVAAAVRHVVEQPTGVVIARDRELLKRVENLLRTMSKIELMLNPLERDQQKSQCLDEGGNRPASFPPCPRGLSRTASSSSAAISSRSRRRSSNGSGGRVKRGE